MCEFAAADMSKKDVFIWYNLVNVSLPRKFANQFDHCEWIMQSDLKKMLKKNEQLNQLDMATVVSHIQREGDEWIYNTIMLEGYDVPFKYLRKKAYKNLKGARVNVTYYPETEQVAGMEFEIMKVVRIKRS